MAREILFKAKRKGNGEWICWNLYGELCRLSGKRTSLAIKNGATTHYYDYIYQVRQLIDEKTICQYTGLTDKNGNKIWENDIMRYRPNYSGNIHKFPVVYENGFYLCKYSDEAIAVLGDIASRSENIGNIFDNPELLEVLS